MADQQRYHVAILKRRYLELILSGKKTVECRLSKVRCAPFGRIAPGHVIFLKESSGCVHGRAIAKRVAFYDDLTSEKIQRLYRQYSHQILGQEDFWTDRQDSRYGTLIHLEQVRRITSPYRLHLSGQRGWHVLTKQQLDRLKHRD